MNYDTSNEMFRLAIDLVNQSNRNIFLTGKAGTGKTTFLKYIRENCPKQTAVVAPTGVAAINAGGVTAHSFFQLPLSPFIPVARGSGKNDETVNRHSLVSRLRMTNEKKKVIQELELLIIDEISMIRCDTLDAIDTVLRHVRSRPQDLFGGVQVLLIGDMFQLPPVIREQEWDLLAGYYNSPYFFDSNVIKQEPPLYIEFTKIYRQNEEQFISLLNQVRNNELDQEGIDLLESRFRPGFRRVGSDGFIILTTHNDKARQINNTELEKLEGQLHTLKAEIKDEFPGNAYPADEILQLKTGAQVMFIRNDSDKSKRYFNGKIGTIAKVEEEKVMVECKDDPTLIEVRKEEWENIRYTLNKTTRALEEKRLGSFSQFPLRLAWAITIHKSQGLTFEKAIVDAGAAFAPGQVYVALSRCTTLDGIVLKSKINTAGLQTDQRILSFGKNKASEEQVRTELEQSAKEYRQLVLLSLFDFGKAINACDELKLYVNEYSTSFNAETSDWLRTIGGLLNSQQEVALKFMRQLGKLFVDGESGLLQERLSAGTAHFSIQLSELIGQFEQSPATTDSYLHGKEYNDGLKEIYIQVALKKHLLDCCLKRGFDLTDYYEQKRSFKAPILKINAYAGSSQRRFPETPNPILYSQLKQLRDRICAAKDTPIYMVAGSQSLFEMVTYLPQTLKELEKISGFGPAKISQFGNQFLGIINTYCEERHLSSMMGEKEHNKIKRASGTRRSDTKAETYKLFKDGKSVMDIARDRNLTMQTIETHLTHYVGLGEIPIGDLVSPEKLALIEPMAKQMGSKSLTQIKEKLDNKANYSEIRLVVAWVEYQKQLGFVG